MINEALWEIEIELAAESFACSGDEDAFRSDMRRLGFDPQEIDDYVERMTG